MSLEKTVEIEENAGGGLDDQELLITLEIFDAKNPAIEDVLPVKMDDLTGAGPFFTAVVPTSDGINFVFKSLSKVIPAVDEQDFEHYLSSQLAYDTWRANGGYCRMRVSFDVKWRLTRRFDLGEEHYAASRERLGLPG
jgi:hypothetical protein